MTNKHIHQTSSPVEAHSQLEKEYRRYKDLFESAPGAYLVTDMDSRIVSANKVALDLLYISQRRILNKPLAVFVPKPARPQFLHQLSEVCTTGRPLEWESALRPRHSAPIHATLKAVCTQTSEEKVLYWFIQDMTDSKRAQEQIRALSSRLIQAIETERRAISRELHDEIGQGLTALRMMVSNSSAEREVLAVVDELIRQTRALSLDLRPGMLDDLGLLPTLLWYFERFTTQTGLHVQFTHSGLDRRCGADVDITAYQIVQEALTNVARHAGVLEVEVRVWVTAQHMYVQVQDEGKGFDPQQVQAQLTSSGLLGMRERAALLGGALETDSTPEGGTCITARLPVTV
jgi:PAS domain S-box-containing protein